MRAIDCRAIVTSVNRLLVYLLSFLMALMPSIALACNAATMLAPVEQMQSMADAPNSDGGAHGCCHEQKAGGEDTNTPASNGSTCQLDAMCAFASATPVTANPVVFVAPLAAIVFVSPSDHFLSADRMPFLRPPTA